MWANREDGVECCGLMVCHLSLFIQLGDPEGHFGTSGGLASTTMAGSN